MKKGGRKNEQRWAIRETFHQRNVLLKEKPGLGIFQEELETILDKTVSDDDRTDTTMLVLHSMLIDLKQAVLRELSELTSKFEVPMKARQDA